MALHRPTVQPSVLVLLSALTYTVGLPACSRGPRSPEAAYQRLAEAVQAHDAEALFDALDQKSRWAWMTVLRSHRESYDIVLSNFPEGADRADKLRRFEAGALANNAGELFAARMGDAALRALGDRLPAAPAKAPTVQATGEQAELPDRSGAPLPFRALEGRWGFAGLAAESEEAQRRAIADLEIIKRSATDYERAAIREKP